MDGTGGTFGRQGYSLVPAVTSFHPFSSLSVVLRRRMSGPSSSRYRAEPVRRLRVLSAMSSLPDLTYHCSGSHWLAMSVAPAELRASMISKMRMLSAASAGVAGKSSRTGRSMLLNSSTFL